MGHRITLVRPRQSETTEQQMVANGANAAVVTTDLLGTKHENSPLPAPANGLTLLSVFCVKSCANFALHIVTEGPLGLAALVAAKRQNIKSSLFRLPHRLS